MGKDPAVNWYFENWAGGTKTYSRHLKGCYMDVLDAQFHNGPLSLEEIKTVLGSDFGSSWPTLQKKFQRTADGLFFNTRLQREMEKRAAYSESRRRNREGQKLEDMPPHMSEHMGNGNGKGTGDGFRKEGAGRKPPADAIQDAQLLDWENWGNLIVDGLDPVWDAYSKSKKISREYMDNFLSVATRNQWEMSTRSKFLTALRGFDPHKFSNNGTTSRKTERAEPTPGKAFGEFR